MTKSSALHGLKTRVVAGLDSLSQRPLGLTITLGLVLASIIFYASETFALAPWRTKRDAERAEVSKLKADNDAAEIIRADEQRFLSEFAEVLDVSQSARQMLPEQVEVSRVLEGVEALAASSGLRVTRFSAARPPVASNKLYEVTVMAQVSGSHPQVIRFLSSLAAHERIIQVRDFSINSNGRSETLDLVLATYYAPPPKDLPAVPAEVTAHGAIPGTR